MKSINEIVTTSIKPEFEKNLENVKNKLRKCMLKDIMSQKEPNLAFKDA